MPLIQNNTNPYGVVDRTDELLIVPNKYGLLQDMGLFKSQGVIGSSFYVDEHEVFTDASGNVEFQSGDDDEHLLGQQRA
jgi:hypothetical protein